MISLLEDIWSFIQAIPDLILYSVEEAINGFFSVFGALVESVLFALPALPETFAPPTIVGVMNWVLPLGAIVATATTFMGFYVTFVAVRWLLQRAGVI